MALHFASHIMIRTLFFVAVTALFGCVIQVPAPEAPPSSVSFAILGDSPYDDETYDRYLRLIDDVNNHPDLAWVLHVGDMKGGVQSCDDKFLRGRYELNQRFEAPFVLTPGDNDWYDCGRELAGAFDDYERLEALRRMFYPDSGSPVGPDAVSQADFDAYPEYVENALWHRAGVTFATLHLLGPTRAPTDPEAAVRDVAAATAWLRRAFASAEERDSAGVFIAMQVDPWVFTGPGELAKEFCPTCNTDRPGLEWFYPLLRQLVINFVKPVVVAVGDTHIFRIDKPLYDDNGQLLTNFTRLEVFGYPDVHWVKVIADPADPNVFSFRQQLVN